MHIFNGLLMRYWLPMWKGKRGRSTLTYTPTKQGRSQSDAEYQEVERERKQDFEIKAGERKDENDKLQALKLTPAQIKEVDQRYASIDWPARLANKYLPFKDSGSFTAADALHFIIYAGIYTTNPSHSLHPQLQKIIQSHKPISDNVCTWVKHNLSLGTTARALFNTAWTLTVIYNRLSL